MSLSFLQRCSAALLGSGVKRRRKTAMTALATLMMVGCTLVLRSLVQVNGLDALAVGWWAGLATAGMLVILVLVRSGWSERLADPSLAHVQMLWALTFNAVAYVIAGPARALVLPVLVIIMMFGIFSYHRRQTWFLFFYAMALFTLAIALIAYSETPRPSAAVLLAHFFIVMACLITSTLMCLQVQGIRGHLRDQKKQLQLALQQIERMAMRDDLTGLVNRRQMSELMALELCRSLRSERPLLLAQLDIDHFKAINDAHGHAVGDFALKAFAQNALAHLRGGDVLARWGGEEFVLLLSDTTPEAANEVFERLRRAIEAQVLEHEEKTVRFTVSIGWAQHQHGESLEETLQRADRALYEAKGAGRNRTVRAQTAS